jgi:hypothetical protein
MANIDALSQHLLSPNNSAPIDLCKSPSFCAMIARKDSKSRLSLVMSLCPRSQSLRRAFASSKLLLLVLTVMLWLHEPESVRIPAPEAVKVLANPPVSLPQSLTAKGCLALHIRRIETFDENEPGSSLELIQFASSRCPSFV